MIRYELIDTAWGSFAAVASERGLIATKLPERNAATIENDLRRWWPGAKAARGMVPGLRRAVRDYFDGRPRPFEVAIDFSGMTEFRQAVMSAAMKVPYGQTASYRDLARAVSRPAGARAVGGVMAANPLPLIVPCHRIVRSDGSIGGFSAVDGIDLKRRMLALEGVTLDDTPDLFARSA